MRTTTWLFAALTTSLLVGCTAETPVGTADVQYLTVEPGYHALTVDDSYVYRDITVDPAVDAAYLAKGPRGIHAVDLGTMSVVRKITHTADGEQLYIDGVQMYEGLLVAWGQRDDAPLSWNADFARSFVIQALAGDEVKWSVTLDLYAALVDPGDSIVQLPNMHAYVADGEIVVSFGHLDEPDRVVVFPVPEGHVSYDFLDIPGATQIDHVDNPKGIAAGDDGFYLAHGPSGVSFVTPEARTVLNDTLGYTVDVRAAEGLTYVADHDGYLHVIASATGERLDSLEVPDWVEGIEIADGYVFVSGREGLFVAEQTWEAPAPVDPPEEPEEPEEPIEEPPVEEPTPCPWWTPWWLCNN